MNTTPLHFIRIMEFEPQWRGDFARLNRQWLQAFFELEPYDEFVLNEPEAALLAAEGKILFALVDGEVVGTVALKNLGNQQMELTKMAVDEKYRGLGIGRKLGERALELATELGVHRILLYSNRRLEPALSLYRSMGFQEIPLETGLYKRADVMMELRLAKQ